MIRNKEENWCLWCRKKLVYQLVLVILFYLLSPLSCAAVRKQGAAKLLIIQLTRVGFADLMTGDYPYLQQLTARGQVGLVSVRVAGQLTPAKVYSILSTVPSGLGKNLEQIPTRGVIGSALHLTGKRTALIGNADLPWKLNRSAKTLICDDRGMVDREITDQTVLCADPEFPFGFRTDYERLGDFALRLLPEMDLLLLETGDLERLESYRGMMTEECWRLRRAQTLARIDRLIGWLRAAIPAETTLLVFSATPSTAGGGNDQTFLPLLIDQENGRPGLLTSAATREKGLITSGDFAALIVDLVEGSVERSPVRTETGAWPELQQKMSYWLTNLRQRKIILRVYLYLIIIFSGLTFLLPLTPWWRHAYLINELLMALAFFPLTLLLIAPFKIDSWLFLTALLIIVTAGLWVGTRRVFASKKQAYRCLLLATTIVIFGDLLFGARLMLASLLGPSPVLGLRFYGLGNEYLGVFLGAFLLGSADFLIRASWRRWTGVLLSIIALFIFSPFGGANFGGGVAFSYAAWLICQRMKLTRVGKENFLYFILFLGGGLSLQILRSGLRGTTHLHNALRLLSFGAFDNLLAIAVRKIRMHLALINYTRWGQILLCGFILFLLILKVREKAEGSTKQEAKWYHLGTIIAVNTGLVALLVNDSGIVVIAPLVIYPLILLADFWSAQERTNILSVLKQAGRRCVGIAKN